MNRPLWTETLSKTWCPHWPCPACRNGTLALVPKSLVENETVESKGLRNHPEWDPDWIRYTFTAWLKCRACDEQVAVSGEGQIGPESDAEGHATWEPYFTPRFCWPPLKLIDMPPKCPDEIKMQLYAAFSLFWCDEGAAANHVRIALERLMDHMGIPIRRKEHTGKYAELTLHRRIDLFQAAEPIIGAQVMALKWLGNTGSHEGQVHRNDLLDAFEILEHVLGELIEPAQPRSHNWLASYSRSTPGLENREDGAAERSAVPMAAARRRFQEADDEAARAEPELHLLHRWLDTWTGVGLITVGVERHGMRLSLSHIADEEWRAVFMGESALLAPRGFGVGADAVAVGAAGGVGGVNRDQ